LRLLADKRRGDRLSLLGPIGVGFHLDPTRRRPLLIGGGVGIPPMIFLADTLRQARELDWKPLVLMGSEVPFPFSDFPAEVEPSPPASSIETSGDTSGGAERAD